MRVGEKETSEQAAIVARYEDLFTREQLDALAHDETEVADDGRERLTRLRLMCEGGILVRELAERDDALENALLAARVPWQGEELPLRTRSSASRDACLVRRAGRARRRGAAGVRVVQRRPEVAPGGARGARCRALRRGEPGGAQRGGEGNRARASARGARRHARGDDRRLHDGTRPVVRPPPRRGARCNPVVRARGVAATAVTARDDVHARAIGAGVQRHTRRARPRPRSRERHPARPRRPAAEVAARVCHPLGPAAARASHHPRAGRPARLRGLSPRGRSRAALRGLRSGASVRVPAAVPRPRADRDLLVPARLDRP